MKGKGELLLSDVIANKWPTGQMTKTVIDTINGIDVIHVASKWSHTGPAVSRYTVTIGPVTHVCEHVVAARMAAQQAGER